MDTPPLEMVGGAIEGAIAAPPDRVRGTLDGHDVEVRFLERYQSHTRLQRTELVLLGALVREDLHLAIVPQRDDDAGEVAEGRGTDVRTDDAAFDAAFLVEAAPADVVRGLLDPAIRARMLAFEGLAISTRGEGLCLEVPRWIDRADSLRALASLGVALVSGAPRAFERAEAMAREVHVGLREVVSPTERAAAHRAEIAGLHARIAERGAHRERRVLRFVLGVFAFCAIVAWIAWLTRG